MNISEMTPRDKSIKLLSLVGCNVDPIIEAQSGMTFQYATFGDGEWLRIGDKNTLYDEKNMGFAWRVLKLTVDNFSDESIYELNKFMLGMGDDDTAFDRYIWYRDNSQTSWLDKILELAINAGMIE